MRNKLLQKKSIVIILVLMFMIPTTYAVFKDKVLGNSNLTLAKWNVTLNQSNVNNSLSIVPEPNEMTASYTVNINSISEVSIIYSIVVDNLPSGVSVSLDGVNYEPEDNHKVVFSNIGTIPYNDATKERQHTLFFKATSNATYVDDSEVSVNVEVRQQV